MPKFTLQYVTLSSEARDTIINRVQQFLILAKNSPRWSCGLEYFFVLLLSEHFEDQYLEKTKRINTEFETLLPEIQIYNKNRFHIHGQKGLGEHE